MILTEQLIVIHVPSVHALLSLMCCDVQSDLAYLDTSVLNEIVD
jgi:hypothetical protein